MADLTILACLGGEEFARQISSQFDSSITYENSEFTNKLKEIMLTLNNRIGFDNMTSFLHIPDTVGRAILD